MLTTFWISSRCRHVPLGFGVTARSRDDALRIIKAFGYGQFLPTEDDALEVIHPVTVRELDPHHVVPNMGPINVRGLWYPFLAVGILNGPRSECTPPH